MSYPFLTQVRKPGRYLGTEINAVRKDWQKARVRLAFIFPDLYEIGMSHLGLSILYHIVNSHADFLAERAFAPDLDLEELLRREDYPLLSLESQRPLREFDILGFTLPYELCYTNVLTVLDTAGIPFYARERPVCRLPVPLARQTGADTGRDENYPLVVAGGSCAVNPEPVADFFDAILIGDGEEAIVEIANAYACWKESRGGKGRLLEALSRIEGVYVPSYFKVSYGSKGTVSAIEPARAGYTKVSRRVVTDLDQAPYPLRPVIPHTKPVHDRISLEISRGCARGCRFCQAGITYRPVRERNPKTILRIAEESLAATGHEELSLLSLSTGDYGNLEPLLTALMNRYSSEQVAISLPSLRVGTLTPEIMAEIKRVRKTGFTLAPESGTARLRAVINKDISEKDLLATAKEAFQAGWNLLKLYFMIGLPTESYEDLKGIADLARRVITCGRHTGRRCQVNVGISTFVPKAHTPFQWEPQIGIEESWQRLDYIKNALQDRRIQVKWHDPRQSFLEGVFSRGDRRLASLIERAYRLGCRLDGWGDQFQFSLWQQAAAETGLDLESYIRKRDLDEILPWGHIDCHVDKEFLIKEKDKAIQGETTPDCRKNGCVLCGACDGKTRMLRLSEPFQESFTLPKRPESTETTRIRIYYGKLEQARFLSHLEITRIFSRALKRAGINLAYSKGFHPMPKMSFSSALPVGTESMAEYVDLTTGGAINPDDLASCLQKEMPEGLIIYSAEKALKTSASAETSYYRIRSDNAVFTTGSIQCFLSAENLPIEQKRKESTRRVDIRPLVKALQYIDARTIALSLANHQKAGAKPAEIVGSIFNLSEEEVRDLHILKLPGNPEECETTEDTEKKNIDQFIKKPFHR
ncbi:MAG: TIGR03960 family B12-binding radical SAM protein [Thermodesulfobacteriota bacterium]